MCRIILLLLLTTGAALAGAPPHHYRIELIQGFSPEDFLNYRHNDMPPPHQPALTGRIEPDVPFKIKSGDGQYKVEGVLNRAPNGALYFKGHADFLSSGSEFNAMIPPGRRDFIPRQYCFSGIVFTFFVRFRSDPD